MSKKNKRPFIESVRSNLKSPCPEGSKWTVDLGQHTLLVGSNASHKSSITQAIELALSGSADDITGRDGVRDSDLLLSLCPRDKDKPEDKNLTATATMSDGDIAVFDIKRKDGTNKKPNHNGPGEHTLVHRSVKAALSGSSDSRRKAFLGWIGGSVSRSDMFALIPSNLHSRFEDLFDHLGKNKDSIDTLLSINAYAAKQSRDLSKQMKGAESVVSGLLQEETEAAPTDEYMKQLEAAMENAQSLLEAAAACSNGVPEHTRQANMEQCEAEMDMIKAQLANLESSLALLESQLSEVPAYVASGLASLDWAVDNDIDQCPTCSSQVGKSHLVNCQTFFRDQTIRVNASNEETVVQISSIKEEHQSLSKHYTSVENNLISIANTPSRTDAGISVEDARDRLNAAQLALNSAQVLKSRWDQVKASRELISSLEEDIQSYKKIKKVCDDTISDLLRKQSDDFVSLVQSYLPDNWEFKVVLSDERTGRDTFSMGLVRDGDLHEALSGVEWATVTTAIAMAITNLSKSDKHPAVLIPEDRAWDGKTLSSVMRSFRNFEGQVIIASTIRPTGRAPAGWTIINMDELSDSWFNATVDEPESDSPPAQEIRKDETIRRPKDSNKLSTASVSAIQMMGFDSHVVSLMSNETAADIIKKKLKPEDVNISKDGGYSLVNGGKALNLPTVPSNK